MVVLLYAAKGGVADPTRIIIINAETERIVINNISTKCVPLLLRHSSDLIDNLSENYAE